MTLSGPRIRRLLYFAGIVKLLGSPGKAGGLPKGNYDLSAVNPNAKAAIEHRSPAAIAADIAAKEQRILELMEEIQEILAPADEGQENEE